MPLRHKKHFIFDMDGTLTVAVHDFDHMREQLGLPPDKAILESISARPAHEQAGLLERLYTLEIDYAKNARPQPGADTLLKALADRGYSLGILTRNSTELASITLAACNLLDYFQTDNILGREFGPPKPDPAGIEHLLKTWNAPRQDAVMIGDFKFDLLAGRAADVTTVHFDTNGDFSWPELTDLGVTRLEEIIEAISGQAGLGKHV
ncbi:MAG: HAD family hydrolase [Gammaproteobacteria bacterium]|nr:HAD family hydrolase [Gammaproteobacteria bacterium]